MPVRHRSSAVRPAARPVASPRARSAAAVLVAVMVSVSVAACSHQGGLDAAASPSSTPPSVPAGPAGSEGPAEEFARPRDTAAAVRAAGLVLLGSEQLAVHYHARLRVRIDGRRVEVPASIGIGTDGISELHTHDTTGTIHIESAEDVPFTLGQFMTEWDVALTPTCLGDRCADAGHALTVTVDGRPHRGNPADIVLGPDMELRTDYGPRG